MSTQSQPERGASEPMAGAPRTETQQQSSSRPPGEGPGRPAYPHDVGMTGGTAHRPEEFNPDDFE
ncbi:hypothetical protein [Thermomonospora catenispora]|uniref:hypothetical protein n=1 Tax=Thermomonospora catenispora TaxID=2493090 RepID=UPI00111DA831|nr:hypothetical protein [Thermomonospora catenispora]TNY37840.1 hypothetical protein EIO00_06725 [Thermomonospora catenispora]